MDKEEQIKQSNKESNEATDDEFLTEEMFLTNLNFLENIEKIISLSKQETIENEKDNKINNVEHLTENEKRLSIFGGLIAKSIEVVFDTLRLFGIENVYVSFNGGKDAVVLLHIFRCGWAKYCRDFLKLNEYNSTVVNKISRSNLIYFHGGENEFSEVEDFVKKTAEQFKFKLKMVDSDYVNGIKRCFGESQIKPIAFIIGNRICDPKGIGMNVIDFSSYWLPPFLRIHPILYFNFYQIWLFIDAFSLPYCTLYDHGFTSIGLMNNSLQNSALFRCDKNSYISARFLDDLSLERKNRIQEIKKKDCDYPFYSSAYNSSFCSSSSYKNNICCIERQRNVNVENKSIKNFSENFKNNFCYAETAGIIVINLEEISDETVNQNSHFSAKQFSNFGIRLIRISFFKFYSNKIVDEIKTQMLRFDLVLVIFDNKNEIEKIISCFCKNEKDVWLNHFKQNSNKLNKIQETQSNYLDFFFYKNVFFFPSDPSLFRKKLKHFTQEFLTRKKTIYKNLRVSCSLGLVSGILEALRIRHPTVHIESYGIFCDDESSNSIITLACKTEKQIKAAIEDFKDCIGNYFSLQVFDLEEGEK